MMHIPCPNCRTMLSIPFQYAGKRGGCNSCKHIFTVPFPANAPPASLENKHAQKPLVLIMGLSGWQFDIVESLCQINGLDYSKLYRKTVTHLVIGNGFEYLATYKKAKARGLPIFYPHDFAEWVETDTNPIYEDCHFVPASEKQLAFLVELGVEVKDLTGISKRTATAYIDYLITEYEKQEDATDSQINLLLDLQVSERKAISVKSKYLASEMISGLVSPDPRLPASCWKHGARARDILRVSNQRQSRELLQETMRTRDVPIPEFIRRIPFTRH